MIAWSEAVENANGWMRMGWDDDRGWLILGEPAGARYRLAVFRTTLQDGSPDDRWWYVGDVTLELERVESVLEALLLAPEGMAGA